MGFSDLLTSSRGPGLIGTLLALLVLVGFGTLYIFVFDEGLQGGKQSLESVLREQVVSIESNKEEILRCKKRLSEGEEFKEQEQEMNRLKVRIDLAKARTTEATQAREGMIAAIDAAKVKWEEYKDAYRASEWASAEGEELGDLKTISGRSFTKVKITKVSHIGVEITDETGKRRIDSSDLPKELQDRFQFDQDRKTAETKHEDNTFQDLSDNVEIATLAKKGQEKVERVAKLNAEIEQARGDMDDARAAEPALLQRIDNIRIELAAEQTKTAERAGRRAQGINRTPQIQAALRAAENRVSENRNSIRDLDRKIYNNRREISILESELRGIKDDIAKIRKDLAAKQQGAAPAKP
jgi:hypothetical protein